MKAHAIVSLAIALAAFLSPAFAGLDSILRVSGCLAAVWAAVVAHGLYRHRKRGLWLLAGAPLALWWQGAWLIWR